MKRFLKFSLLICLVIPVAVVLVACGTKITDKTFTKYGISIALTSEWRVNFESERQYDLANHRIMLYCNFGFDNNQEGDFLYTYSAYPRTGYVANDEQLKLMAQAYVTYVSGSISPAQMFESVNARFAYAFYYKNAEPSKGISAKAGVRLIFQTPDSFGYYHITIHGELESFDEEEIFKIFETIKVKY